MDSGGVSIDQERRPLEVPHRRSVVDSLGHQPILLISPAGAAVQSRHQVRIGPMQAMLQQVDEEMVVWATVHSFSP
jgi:hypothetical protein